MPVTLNKKSKNVLESLDGLATLSQLEELYAGQNIVASIEADAPSDSHQINDWNPDNHPSLRYLDLSDNNLSDSEQVCFLQPLLLLRDLKLVGNPMTKSGFDFGEYTRAYSVDTMNSLAAQNSHCMNIIGGAGVSSRDNLNSRSQLLESKNSSMSYRLHLVFILSQLTCLDGICITAEEKVYRLKFTRRSPLPTAFVHLQKS